MEQYIARFGEIEPQGGRLAEKLGIPLAAYQKMTAEKFFLLMSSPELGGPFADQPAISDDQGMIVAIVKCAPGQGPYLHAHYNTYENFICLTGRFRISWGDVGEHEAFLDPVHHSSLDGARAHSVDTDPFAHFTSDDKTGINTTMH